jgi:hypothetical protein
VLLDEEILSSPARTPQRPAAKGQARSTETSSKATIACAEPAPAPVERRVPEPAPPTRSYDVGGIDGSSDSSYSSFEEDAATPVKVPPTTDTVEPAAASEPCTPPAKMGPPSKTSPPPEDILSSLPQLPRRPQSCVAGSRPKHIALGRKELLGKGTFGMVYRAMDLDTNRIIAVKEITIAPGSMKPEQLDTIRREIAILQKLDHPNIVQCLGEHWDGHQHLRIFMEYVAGGTISALIRSFGPLSEPQASRYTAQMLRGLSYLHAKRIAHRDLKGDNLLVDVDGGLKLADFGTAKELATRSKSVAGTAYFMAPEVIRGVGHGIEADVWSAGCCVVEMLQGKPPFSHFSNQYAIMMHIAELKVGDFPVPPNLSESCCNFLQKCFEPNPDARATIDDLLNHDWILNPPQQGDLKSINVLSANGESLPVNPTRGKTPDALGSFNPMQTVDGDDD